MLVVGDDWAEAHHDVELQDEAGRRLGKAKLQEGIAGVVRLHELVAEHQDAEPEQVVVGIETDRGPWVQTLLAAGSRVWAINPLQVARYRQRHSVSGANSDAADAHTWPTWCALTGSSCGRSPATATWPRRSGWSLGPTRRLSGSGPATRCGYGTPCGSSSPPPWSRSRI